jgi:hypothetical protein
MWQAKPRRGFELMKIVFARLSASVLPDFAAPRGARTGRFE